MAMTPNRTRHGLVALSRVLPYAAVLALVFAYRLIKSSGRAPPRRP